MNKNIPYQIDERTRYLGFEIDGEVIEYLPYLNLRRIKFEPGAKRQNEKIELHYDFALCTIEGQNLMDLVTLIRQESLSLIRKGISEDPSNPMVSEVRLIFREN